MENNLYDDFEFDLLNLINTDTNNTNQYLIFEGSNGENYAINISKVVEVVVYKNLDMVKNGNDHKLIRATAKIRDEIASIICFDEWFGNDVLEEKDYEYAILVGFGGYNLAIMVKNVEYIVTINYEDMKDNSLNNSKTNFISKIKLGDKEKLCSIFDGDRFLLDIFEDNYKSNSIDKIYTKNKFSNDYYIYFADDSSFIRKMVFSLFEKLGIKSKIFENGKELLDELKNNNSCEVGLIITDLEMPIMDGWGLIKSLNELKSYDNINIIVHTNMSNFVIEKSLIDLGVKDVISKIDMHKLAISIEKYFAK